ncbi:hypothetical protein SAMN05443572_11072 [Myxococcus fulvus]|uniref:Lipoprotein n=1 Tax=Myxococcus fulvus TaxID=33 RepID=A0A511T836_MYXFU|nr:hypothetical protein [Myxococcus fulvus]GEN10325.1 hypothetical protein MFU01_53620 [Myxococcus fulvus]SEU34533.1 hypothetical protein SAMN05443572_11072 [Myxococcus fulvus]
MSKSWSVVVSILAVQWLACAGGGEAQPEGPSGEMRLSVQGLAHGELDSLVVTAQPANVSQTLTYSATSDTFEGTLVLPAGAQTLTAEGFVEDGTGTPVLVASGTVTVTVVAGSTVGVFLDIRDVTPAAPQPDIAPFIRSSISGAVVIRPYTLTELGVDVIDLDGDPITYQWTSDCPTSVFTRPNASYTEWYNTVTGACRLEVRATARGQTVSRAINVTVYSLTPTTGDVDVEGTYTPRPLITAIHAQGQGLPLQTFLRESAVTRFPTVGPNRTFQVDIFVDYGTSHGTRTATLELVSGVPCGTLVRGADTCATSPAPTSCSVRYAWTTPMPTALCKLTARATNGTLADAFTVGTMVDWVP